MTDDQITRSIEGLNCKQRHQMAVLVLRGCRFEAGLLYWQVSNPNGDTIYAWDTLPECIKRVWAAEMETK